MTVSEGFRHQALFYRDEREFLDGTAAFIRDGIEAGEPTLVAVSERKIGLLKARLNGEADRVRFVDMTSVGRNPARIIPVWRDFVEEAAGRPLRGIGEPAWPGRSEAEFSECDRHESLLNAAFAGPVGEGFSLLCPYDTQLLDRDVLDAARRNHPQVVNGSGSANSADYLSPVTAPDPFSGDLPAPPPDAERVEFAAGTLDGVRRFVWAHAHAAGLEPSAQGDVVLAVHELAANSVCYGGGRGSVTVWEEPGALICQVEDAGRFDDPLVGRRRPDGFAETGRGLWIVNQLCDLVQIRSGPTGSVVRVRVETG